MNLSTLATLPPKPAIVPGIGSVWRHHKGGFYRVTGATRHSEAPDQWLVSYEPLAGGEGWTRALLQRPSNDWPGFMDAAVAGEPFRFRHVSGPRSWRDEAPAEDSADRLHDAAPLMLAALKAYRDQYAGRETWPDDEVACLELADAALAAAEPPASRPTVTITWREENYGAVSGKVAFRTYDRHLLVEVARRRADRTIRDAGFIWHDQRSAWLADAMPGRKAGLTAALEAAGFQVKHAGAVPTEG